MRTKIWHVNRRSNEKRQTDPPIEDLKEQRHLGNALSKCLYWKVKLQGRQLSHASNGKYLGKWLPPPHLMHCTNWTVRIYEEKTAKQCFHSSQPFLSPLEGSWWDKHPKSFTESYRWRAKMQQRVLYKERILTKSGGGGIMNRERGKKEEKT